MRPKAQLHEFTISGEVWIDVFRAAQIAKTSVHMIRRYARIGRLTAKKYNGRWWFLEQEVTEQFDPTIQFNKPVYDRLADI